MIIMLGLPGAGKGTVAKLLAEQINYNHVSTGEILREEIAQGTGLGKTVKDFVEKGELVPDHIIAEAVVNKIARGDDIILDGYPRNKSQADFLLSLEGYDSLDIEAIVFLEISEETIFKRLRRRREIENRPDDTDEVIKKRLDNAKQELLPMVEELKNHPKFVTIDGEDEAEQNVKDILKEL